MTQILSRLISYKNSSLLLESPQKTACGQLHIKLENAFGSIRDSRDSTWNPDQNIDDFLQVFRKYGPTLIEGQFGKHCYVEPPIEVDKNQHTKATWGWPRNAKRAQNSQMNFIVVLEVVKIVSRNNAGGYVYFVDLNDPIDSGHPENDVLYKISHQNLKAYTKKSPSTKVYAVHFRL